MKKETEEKILFMSPVRLDLPKGRLDKNYVVIKEKPGPNYYTFTVIDKTSGKKERKIAEASFVKRSNRMQIYNVWTHEKYRNLGLQKMLFEVIGQEARGVGKKKMSLLIKKESVPFYKKMGFIKKSDKMPIIMEKQTPKSTNLPVIKTFSERKKMRRRK